MWRRPGTFSSYLLASGGTLLLFTLSFCSGAQATLPRIGQKALVRRESGELFREDDLTNEIALISGLDAGVMELSADAQNCRDCCNNGERNVPCSDVEACAANAPLTGAKYAFVLTHVGRPSQGFLPNVESMRRIANASGSNQIDILLIMTNADAQSMDVERKQEIASKGVRLVEVDWAVPPDMLWTRPHDWCGQQDLIRLHAFGLEGYDAIAYYDSDVEMQGDVLPVFRCASTGKFITTNGGIGEPLNVGFFALRPNPMTLQAARNFARLATFDDKTGWSNNNFTPSNGYYVGAECGQGFFHTLFYMKTAVGRQALEEAGYGRDGRVFESIQIDKCIWNYQTSFQCKSDFDCKLVRAHHKPGRPGQRGSDSNECMKKGSHRR
eukprot:TRINITY_DN25631_c0_g1_i1.p1 TRINITY_DN25631_c0_g1~~TRINITY_DN25631_c0_g1_i1.p1  ORF type:complete len:383 (+),score=48.36 TRINITY_DN25631_c0_g1_i1:88-1236(+)